MPKTMDTIALQRAISYSRKWDDSWTYLFKDDSVLWFYKGDVILLTKEEALRKWRRL